MNQYFQHRLRFLQNAHKNLIQTQNVMLESMNGIFNRYENPVLTALHTPLEWRFDFNPATNPHLLERFGINAVFNVGSVTYVESIDSYTFFIATQAGVYRNRLYLVF